MLLKQAPSVLGKKPTPITAFYSYYRIQQKGHCSCKQLKQSIQQYMTAKLKLILLYSCY